MPGQEASRTENELIKGRARRVLSTTSSSSLAHNTVVPKFRRGTEFTTTSCLSQLVTDGEFVEPNCYPGPEWQADSCQITGVG
jgi:hypothetical protein